MDDSHVETNPDALQERFPTMSSHVKDFLAVDTSESGSAKQIANHMINTAVTPIKTGHELASMGIKSPIVYSKEKREARIKEAVDAARYVADKKGVVNIDGYLKESWSESAPKNIFGDWNPFAGEDRK